MFDTEKLLNASSISKRVLNAAGPTATATRTRYWYKRKKRLRGSTMPQLKTLDAALRKSHDQDQQPSLAIGAVAIVDGAVPDTDLLKQLLAERIQVIPRCAQVLRTHPF